MPKPWSERALVLAVTLALITAVVWGWQAAVFRAPRDEVKGEPWNRVVDEYPMPKDAAEPAPLSPELVESVVRANPFSPNRRLMPPTNKASATGGTVTLLPSQFLYKGRINVGQRQRAIVEEATTRKTYFLEVGQEVAGFKVLDISENRVVLSDPQTKQEVVVSLTVRESP